MRKIEDQSRWSSEWANGNAQPFKYIEFLKCTFQFFRIHNFSNRSNSISESFCYWDTCIFRFFLLLLWHHFLLFMYRFFSFSFQVYFEWKHKRFTSYYELYFFNYKTISPFNNFTMILKCESKLYHNQIRNERKKIVCLCMSVMCLCASAEEKIILGRFNLLMI